MPGWRTEIAFFAKELRLRVADSTTINVKPQGNGKFEVWVSLMEIYNEQILDLLDPTPIGKGKSCVENGSQ